MDKTKLILPVSILLGCFILGGFYYASEVDKQASIERQQQATVQTQQQTVLQANTDQVRAVKIATTTANIKLSAPQKVNTKADDYVVMYDEKGNPLDWSTILRATAIMNDSLTAYETALPEIQKVQDTENQSLDTAYGLLASSASTSTKSQLQTLIQYEEAYITAGNKIIGWLTDSIQNYQDLFMVANERDPQLYIYYSQQISALEAQKSSIFQDYSDAQAAKQDYAKSWLAQQ